MAVAPAIDLTDAQRRTVLALLSQYLPNTTVWAYGSRVKWTSRPASDLDLVVFATPSQSARLAELREAFDESDLPFQVDLFVWDDVSSDTRERIEAEYVVLAEGGCRGKNWLRVALGSITQLTLSNVDKKTKLDEEPVRLCNYMDVYSNSYIRPHLDFMPATATKREIERCSLQPGDVVITKDSEQHDDIGVPALVHDSCADDLVCGYHLALLRPRIDAALSPYLLYALQTSDVRHQFSSYANGVTRFSLRKDDILRVEIPLPPLPEQRAIGCILGALDDKIDLNHRMATTLDEAAKTLFKSWFVDFDPVRAAKRNAHVGVGAAPLFPDHLTKSEIGETPDGWMVGTLGDLCEQPQYGYTASAQNPSDSPKFLRITDINKRPWIDWSDVPSCEIDERQFERYRLRKGDVLIARMADPGHGVLVEEDRKAVFASYLIRFRPANEGLGRYLQYWLRSDEYWSLVSERSAGTTRTSLNARALSQFPLVVPPAHVVDAFASNVSALRDRVIHDTAEAASLAELRGALLPRLISGEVRIRDAERIVEAAT